jgi:hypothetical protein
MHQRANQSGFAFCPFDGFLVSLGMTKKDIYPDLSSRALRQACAEWTLSESEGEIEVLRTGGKFRSTYQKIAPGKKHPRNDRLKLPLIRACFAHTGQDICVVILNHLLLTDNHPLNTPHVLKSIP